MAERPIAPSDTGSGLRHGQGERIGSRSCCAERWIELKALPESPSSSPPISMKPPSPPPPGPISGDSLGGPRPEAPRTFFPSISRRLRGLQGDSGALHVLCAQSGARSALLQIDLCRAATSSSTCTRHSQSAIIPMFHRALIPGGILLLGGSESLSRHERLFEALDKTARIFQATEAPSPALIFP